MLVRKIELENVKCFSSRTSIDLTLGRAEPHKWVVVYGDNGLGKSTLLRSFALALTGQPSLNALLPSAEGWVRGGNKSATIRVVTSKGPGDTSVGSPRARPIELTWTLVGSSSLKVGRTLYPAFSILLNEGIKKVEKDDVKLFQTQIATEEKGRGWLMCGYGPHRRLTGAASDVAEMISPESRAARLVTLFHEKAAITAAERWLRELHHQKSIDSDSSGARTLKAVTEMINHGLLPEGIGLNEITPEGVFFKTPFKSNVPMADLSDGNRTVLAMTLDLLRHISHSFELSGVLEKTDDGFTRITAEGIVLIDEVDSHLHPSWQRSIGNWLHQRFPNLQFIVATHSPMIATRVSEEHGMVVRLMRKRQGRGEVVVAETDEGTVGLTADQNLTGPNFGLPSTRDVLTDNLLAEIKHLRRQIQGGQAEGNARERLTQLEFHFAKLAPASPSFEGITSWRDETQRLQELVARLRTEQVSQ